LFFKLSLSVFTNKYKGQIKKSSLIILIYILQTVCFAVEYFFRYKNQDLPLNSFEDKTGNIISAVFFLSVSLLLLISLFNSSKIKPVNISFLLTLSVVSVILISLTGIKFTKEIKIILAGLFLAFSVFTFSCLISLMLKGFREIGYFRPFLISILIFVSGLSIIFLNILNYTDKSEKYFDQKQKADAGVILGAAVWGGNRPSPVLKERINKGYDIYHKNIAEKLVLTGGGSPNELTEGEVSKNLLLRYGVEPENLILENHSSSTVEQIHFVRDSLYKKSNWHTILLVSDLYHLPRAEEISKFNNLNADGIASDREISNWNAVSFCLKESLALLVFWIFGI